ncbi:MAG: FHA domain-containing protein [Blastocatellia bacterium]|nr:FHA domain-containing protein [Blastocatellia bacterium]
MPKLTITYIDADGAKQSFELSNARAIIGRHSACDVSISDGRLSREHLAIERDRDEFFAIDLNSSNGSELNNELIVERIRLNSGDKLSLGGLEVDIEIEESPEAEADPKRSSPSEAQIEAPQAVEQDPQDEGSSVKTFFVIAAVMVIFVAVVLGVMLIMMPGQKKGGNGNFITSTFDEPTPRPEASRSASPTPAIEVSNGNNSVTPPDNTGTTKPPTEIDAKVEQNAAKFLQKAAANDQRAFITGAQAQIVASRVKSLAGSSAVSDNIVSARKSASAINEIARAKNLKPQFVAAAAVAKLGTSRGDVLATARSMADTLDRFGTQIGNELSDDCLVLIAALDQVDPMKMRNMLQSLATSSSESPRTIRSIWWLKKNGKITDAEYESALRFLAVGTIAQNPADFGVNIEGWNF